MRLAPSTFLSVIASLAVLGTAFASETFSSLPADLQTRLKAGEIVTLDRRPGEKGKVDKRFTTMAKLMKGSRSVIWEVINDKENSDKFLDGVLESRIVSRSGNQVVVEQRTRVGGPKGSYRYTLKYTLTPETRADFSFVKGEIKNAEGAWWIFDSPDPKTKLVIYALHIDPGPFAPQFIVKQGMKKTIPGTILSTEKEVIRRENLRKNP